MDSIPDKDISPAREVVFHLPADLNDKKLSSQVEQAASILPLRVETAAIKTEQGTGQRKIEVLFNDNTELSFDVNQTSGLYGQPTSSQTALKVAALQENMEAVRTLKKAGVKLVEIENEGLQETLFFSIVKKALRAAKTGSAEAEIKSVRGLLEAGVDANAHNGTETPLMLAGKLGDMPLVKVLLDAGVDRNFRNSINETALLMAVKSGNVEFVRMLTEGSGSEVLEASDKDGRTPLMLTIMARTDPANKVKMIEILLAAGANPHASTEIFGSVMDYALSYGEKEVLNGFKNAGVGFSKEKIESNLVSALMSGDIESVQKFLDWGVDINTLIPMKIKEDEDTTKYSKTLFMLASESKQKKLMYFLKAQGADVDACNEQGTTALETAALDQDTEWARVLKEEFNADPKLVQDIARRKQLAHIWGLEGHSVIVNKSGRPQLFSVEGMVRENALSILFKYTIDFFASSRYADKILSKAHQSDLQNCIATASPLLKFDPLMVEARLAAGKSYMILGGSQGHAISFIIHNDRVFMCNRGSGKGVFAVQSYPILKSNGPRITIEQLLETYPSMKAFYNMRFWKQLGGASLGVRLVDEYKQKDQGTGNCAWASSKGAFGILCKIYADPQRTPADSLSEVAKKKGDQLYKEFTAYSRDRALIEYLEQTPPDMQDLEMLRKIKQKCGKKKGLSASKETLKKINLSDIQASSSSQASSTEPNLVSTTSSRLWSFPFFKK